MKAVTNAGPLVALAKLGLLNLLPRLYDPLLAPGVVFDEVVTRGLELGEADAYAVQLAVARRELLIEDFEDEALAGMTQSESLHAGERAAIALALREQADWVLLDDQLAREQAKAAGLCVKGTLGVIIEAHRKQLLGAQEVEVTFQAILDRDDIWISDALVRRVWHAWREGNGNP